MRGTPSPAEDDELYYYTENEKEKNRNTEEI